MLINYQYVYIYINSLHLGLINIYCLGYRILISFLLAIYNYFIFGEERAMQYMLFHSF